MQGSIIKIEGKTGTKWAIRFIDQEGRRRYKTIGARKVDAQKALTEIMGQVHKGEYRELPDITFKEFAAKWLSAHAANVRPKTLASYEQHLRGHISPYFGPRKLKGITVEDAEAFKAHLIEGGVSPATAGKVLFTVKTVLTQAVRWKYLRENPAQFVKRPHRTRPEMDCLKAAEIVRLLDAIDRRHYALMATACFTGLRQGELLGLKWEDIDFINSRIFVRRTLQDGKFYEPKSATSKRSVSVPGAVIDALKEHQARQAVELDSNERELVFPNEAGKALDRHNLLSRIFWPALKMAGLRRVRFHDLRHSYAAALIGAKQNIKWIQKQLGHSSIQITMDVYGHLLPDAEQDAAAKLDAIFTPEREAVRL